MSEEKQTRLVEVREQINRLARITGKLHLAVRHWGPDMDSTLGDAAKSLAEAYSVLRSFPDAWVPPRKNPEPRRLGAGEVVSIRSSRRAQYEGVLPSLENLVVDSLSPNGKGVYLKVDGAPGPVLIPRKDLVPATGAAEEDASPDAPAAPVAADQI